MVTNESQSEFTRQIIADVQQDGQINMKEYNFDLMFQLTSINKKGEVDFNLRIPERIARWHAILQTTSSADGFKSTFKDVPIERVETEQQKENFMTKFGV